jgi:hypothetical protein
MTHEKQPTGPSGNETTRNRNIVFKKIEKSRQKIFPKKGVTQQC